MHKELSDGRCAFFKATHNTRSTGSAEYSALIRKKRNANNNRRTATKRPAVDITGGSETPEIEPTTKKQRKEEAKPLHLAGITASANNVKPATKREKKKEKTDNSGPAPAGQKRRFSMTPWDEKDAPPPRKRVRFEITAG
ncbi:hypothetical protein HPULCUR_003437 [Helicostylum pulchrum]|uniref:Uncharacterized protein n=1 Tax=Helicostylum pulchrum TaxID=562976 RepID=A0ABP9XTD1_9FUNG